MAEIQLGRDPAFESFLAAAVGEDATGAKVTVLSMLARLEVDPWVEALALAKVQDAPARHAATSGCDPSFRCADLYDPGDCVASWVDHHAIER